MTKEQMVQAQWAYATILTNPYPRVEDLIQLDVYYDSIELTIKETAEKISVFDLISNIGDMFIITQLIFEFNPRLFLNYRRPDGSLGWNVSNIVCSGGI